MQSVNPPGLWMYQLWRCLKIRNTSSGSGISSTITFQARDRTTSRYPCATKFRKPLISFHGYSGKAPRPVYAALKRRTSSFSMLLRNAGRICSGGLVTISTSRPSSFSSSRESSYSVPNVIVSPQTRRKSISLSGVCSPRAKEPNRYASRTS